MSGMLRIILVVCALVSFPATSAAHTVITRMTDRQVLTLPQLAAVAGASDVILIGEVHDMKYHHDLQLDLIRSMFERKVPLAIALEMIQSDYQNHLDAWVDGKMTEGEMRMVFAVNWSPEDWEMYREIFLFARDNRIPMVALNVPLDVVRKVAEQGFAALTPEERKGLPAGTSCDLNNPQIAMLRKTFAKVPHHAGHGKMFNNFCEAQTVRNSGMAVTLSRYAGGHPGRRIVTLTGIWHAIKYAVPDQLQRSGSRLSCTVILPETPQVNSGNATAGEADYLVEL